MRLTGKDKARAALREIAEELQDPNSEVAQKLAPHGITTVADALRAYLAAFKYMEGVHVDEFLDDPHRIEKGSPNGGQRDVRFTENGISYVGCASDATTYWPMGNFDFYGLEVL